MHWPVKGTLLLVVVGLTGCATGTGGIQLQDLRRDSLQRHERIVEMDFAQIQSSLFKHEAACGSAPRFELQRGETSYGWLIQKSSPSDGLDKAVVAELTLLGGSWRHALRTRISVYSYYDDREVQDRVRRLLVAVLRPGTCDADAVPDLPRDSDEEPSWKRDIIDAGA